MLSAVERRSRRWLLRRLERQARRRLAAVPKSAPLLVAAASVVDGYCERLGPAGNDDLPAGHRRGRPPLGLIRT